eukprot:13425738-Alexandrium_andersonii.AAC.1
MVSALARGRGGHSGAPAPHRLYSEMHRRDRHARTAAAEADTHSRLGPIMNSRSAAKAPTGKST